jgi:hypothetical protein
LSSTKKDFSRKGAKAQRQTHVRRFAFSFYVLFVPFVANSPPAGCRPPKKISHAEAQRRKDKLTCDVFGFSFYMLFVPFVANSLPAGCRPPKKISHAEAQRRKDKHVRRFRFFLLCAFCAFCG